MLMIILESFPVYIKDGHDGFFDLMDAYKDALNRAGFIDNDEERFLFQ